jgi:hypothetical protein
MVITSTLNTDILSFPFQDYEEPGELIVEPEFDIPDYYTH